MKNKYTLYFAIFIWMMSSVIILLWLTEDKIKSFDPDDQMYSSLMSGKLERDMLSLVDKVTMNEGGLILHFIDDSCFCQDIASKHIHSVMRFAENEGYRNHIIRVDELPHVKEMLPSFPATAVINGNGKVVYVGAYSSGIFCSEGNGIVENFIRNGISLPKFTQISSDAEGCYCNNNKIN